MPLQLEGQALIAGQNTPRPLLAAISLVFCTLCVLYDMSQQWDQHKHFKAPSMRCLAHTAASKREERETATRLQRRAYTLLPPLVVVLQGALGIHQQLQECPQLDFAATQRELSNLWQRAAAGAAAESRAAAAECKAAAAESRAAAAELKVAQMQQERKDLGL